MASYVIHPIVCGLNATDQGVMTYLRAYGRAIHIPIYVFALLGGPTPALIDTGLADFVIPDGLEDELGLRAEYFEDGLARLGLKPDDIGVIVHTHLHNDHCENDYKCANARIYVHEKELEHIHDPHPLDYRYLEDYILDVEENGQLEVLTGDAEIVPGVRVMHTPAHTEGGMTVLVDTAKGVAAITGFCVIMENLLPPKEITAREMEVIPCGTVVNAYQAYDSMVKVKQAADILLPLHEPRFAATPAIPE